MLSSLLLIGSRIHRDLILPCGSLIEKFPAKYSKLTFSVESGIDWHRQTCYLESFLRYLDHLLSTFYADCFVAFTRLCTNMHTASSIAPHVIGIALRLQIERQQALQWPCHAKNLVSAQNIPSSPLMLPLTMLSDLPHDFFKDPAAKHHYISNVKDASLTQKEQQSKQYLDELYCA